MIRTPLCALLGVDHPLVQGALGPWNSVELAAAVSNAGGLGTLASTLRTPAEVAADIERIRELTDRPFAVNHTKRPFSPEAFEATLEARPPAVSLALGSPGELIERAHEAGALFIQQVHTAEQAGEAAEQGADVVVAQGDEAGGFGGGATTFTLVPQVVDAVAPLPVIAAGGIADGRGVAAALALGAQGVQLGTRFLAADEAAVPAEFRRAVLAAGRGATHRLDLPAEALPPEGEGGYGTRPRVLTTPLLAEWSERLSTGTGTTADLAEEISAALREGRAHEVLPLAGESAALVRESLPAAEVVRRLVAEAEAALAAAAGPA